MYRTRASRLVGGNVAFTRRRNAVAIGVHIPQQNGRYCWGRAGRTTALISPLDRNGSTMAWAWENVVGVPIWMLLGMPSWTLYIGIIQPVLCATELPTALPCNASVLRGSISFRVGIAKHILSRHVQSKSRSAVGFLSGKLSGLLRYEYWYGGSFLSTDYNL
jgi:hypothetical protein